MIFFRHDFDGSAAEGVAGYSLLRAICRDFIARRRSTHVERRPV
jgi:hypothetical protein